MRHSKPSCELSIELIGNSGSTSSRKISEDETFAELVQENSGYVTQFLRIYQDFIFYFDLLLFC